MAPPSLLFRSTLLAAIFLFLVFTLRYTPLSPSSHRSLLSSSSYGGRFRAVDSGEKSTGSGGEKKGTAQLRGSTSPVADLPMNGDVHASADFPPAFDSAPASPPVGGRHAVHPHTRPTTFPKATTSHSHSIGRAIGIVVGSGAGVVVLGVILYWLYRLYLKMKEDNGSLALTSLVELTTQRRDQPAATAAPNPTTGGEITAAGD